MGVLAMVALLPAVALAGCSDLGLDSKDKNQAPVAQLEADRTRAWAGEEFAFDAQSSHDPDGNVTRWRFDFGDGTNQTVHRADDARVKHAYRQGGDYNVTVTVVDDGKGGLETRDDSASVQVSVDERVPVDPSVLYAAPLNATPARHTQTFQVRDGAERVEASLELRSVLLAGSSQVRVRILDPSQHVLMEMNETIEAASNQTLEMDAMLEDVGSHTLEIEARSGGVQAGGELRVLYFGNGDRE